MVDPHPTRVVLLTSPGAYGAIIINTLAACQGVDIAGIGLTNRVYRGKGLLGTVRTSVKRMGWRYTTYSALAANLAWARLRLSGRPRGLRNCGRVLPINDVNSAETVDWIRDSNADYVASFYFNQWIGPTVRDLPRKACINMHPSLLPALRGPDPAFRTLERRLGEGGLTIHHVTDEFDAGEILAQRKLLVDTSQSVFGLYCEWAAQGASFLGEWLLQNHHASDETRSSATDRDASRETPARADSRSDQPRGDYTTFPTAREVHDFVRQGGQLVTMSELSRRVREIE